MAGEDVDEAPGWWRRHLSEGERWRPREAAVSRACHRGGRAAAAGHASLEALERSGFLPGAGGGCRMQLPDTLPCEGMTAQTKRQKKFKNSRGLPPPRRGQPERSPGNRFSFLPLGSTGPRPLILLDSFTAAQTMAATRGPTVLSHIPLSPGEKGPNSMAARPDGSGGWYRPVRRPASPPDSRQAL